VITPLQAPAWRTAHPWAFPLACAASVAAALVWWPVGLAGLGLIVASLAAESWWRRFAVRAGCTARWVIPTSRRWWAHRLRRLGLPPLPPGPVWEIHVQDARRWPGTTPAAAAQTFRAAYRTDMAYWLAHRPPGVSVVSSSFNRPTLAEIDQIVAAGGALAPGAIHPRLAAVMTPAAYGRLQRRMFGAVVSTTRRTDPAQWTTWVVPPRRRVLPETKNADGSVRSEAPRTVQRSKV